MPSRTCPLAPRRQFGSSNHASSLNLLFPPSADLLSGELCLPAAQRVRRPRESTSERPLHHSTHTPRITESAQARSLWLTRIVWYVCMYVCRLYECM